MEHNYRLKQEIITDFIRQRMPTLCEIEKPLKWWLDNNIVQSDEDLELCDSSCLSREKDEYYKKNSISNVSGVGIMKP